MAERNIDVINPYSGQIATVNKEEEKLYYIIKNAEVNEDYKTMQKGLDKFSRLNPKAYMILLD
tara:strand:- start:55 stop:243 length:189 start_codon:yes stop_codon:yes gene_type:complete